MHIADFFFLIVSITLLIDNSSQALNQTAVPVKVGLILDFSTQDAKISNTCITMAIEDFYASRRSHKKRLDLRVRDSQADFLRAASAALDLLKNVEVEAILGPQTSGEANFVTMLGNKTQVPVISFTATSPSLSSFKAPYFIRTAQKDSAQIGAIVAIVKAFAWHRIVPVYEDTEFGKGMMPLLIDALEQIGVGIPYRTVLRPSSSNDLIRQELYKLMTMQTRVFVVHLNPNLGSQLFLNAKEIGMMGEGYVWITTNGLGNTLGTLSSTTIDSMQGVIGLQTYVPESEGLDDFATRWKLRFQSQNRDQDPPVLNVFGLWAYDTTWALCSALEESGAGNSRYVHDGAIEHSTVDMDTLGVSPTGSKLLEVLSATNVTGLSGQFQLVDGELNSTIIQIVNVVGNEFRKVGFWSPYTGLCKFLGERNQEEGDETPSTRLGAISWPGDPDPNVTPRGWQIPTNGKGLRIGVPVNGPTNFVNVEFNSMTNDSKVTGYCIDVFKEVVNNLPYALPYKFIPFSTSSYDMLVHQVNIQNFDAVVGDVTITWNRTKYVDFTVPYRESSVAMVVLLTKGDKMQKSSGWIFLKPLSKELWLTTAAFCIFNGAVFWALEKKNDSRLHKKLGWILYYSFSRMVNAQDVQPRRSLSRFVSVVWLFVVIILMSSYTANLSSMLTLQKLYPAVADFETLINNGDYIGCQGGSFVVAMLKRMNVDPSKLRFYATADFPDALRDGSISAFFDEVCYINRVLDQNPNSFAMVGPTYKTGGFGFLCLDEKCMLSIGWPICVLLPFQQSVEHSILARHPLPKQPHFQVFQKGSPLVSDFSEAILSVLEGDRMPKIEKAWLGKDATSSSDQDTANQEESGSLGLSSFWVLFFFTGLSSLVALSIMLIGPKCRKPAVGVGFQADTANNIGEEDTLFISDWQTAVRLVHSTVHQPSESNLNQQEVANEAGNYDQEAGFGARSSFHYIGEVQHATVDHLLGDASDQHMILYQTAGSLRIQSDKN